MKRIITYSVFLLASVHAQAQTYSTTVVNGYGSGNYMPGDTVYVFAKEFGYNEVFVNWTLQPEALKTLDDSREWRFRFVMPARNIKVTANFRKLVASDTIAYEKIKGKDTLKNVYYCFPAHQKGVVFIFHGSGSRANAWIGTNNFDRFNLTKDLIAAGYGVIITECEEATLNRDLNGDGKIAWNINPLDSINNIDYANLTALLDTFRQRGKIQSTTRLFCVGMSAGGFMSSAFSYYFNCGAGIAYCAASDTGIVTKSTVPFLFCLAPNDHIITAGGNDTAYLDSDTLQMRGICSHVFMNEVYPVYPQYFARSDSISLYQSKNIYTELLVNNCIDNKGFLLLTPMQVDSFIEARPEIFKTISHISASEVNEFVQLLNIAFGDHEFYSDHDKQSIAFLDSMCLSVTGVPDIQNAQMIHIDPDPVHQMLTLQLPPSEFDLVIFDVTGRKVFERKSAAGTLQINCAPFQNGLYFLKAENGRTAITTKFIKQ